MANQAIYYATAAVRKKTAESYNNYGQLKKKSYSSSAPLETVGDLRRQNSQKDPLKRKSVTRRKS